MPAQKKKNRKHIKSEHSALQIVVDLWYSLMDRLRSVKNCTFTPISLSAISIRKASWKYGIHPGPLNLPDPRRSLFPMVPARIVLTTGNVTITWAAAIGKRSKHMVTINSTGLIPVVPVHQGEGHLSPRKREFSPGYSHGEAGMLKK
jgi:hypothetical protein